MVFGELLARLTTQTRAIVRKLEKLNYRSVQSSFGIKFNRTCIKEDILPKFTEIRIHDPRVRYEDCTLRFRRDILNVNLTKCEEEFKSTFPLNFVPHLFRPS